MCACNPTVNMRSDFNKLSGAVVLFEIHLICYKLFSCTRTQNISMDIGEII